MVTVLMSVRDTPPELLEAASRSILQQSFADFEFLILDDGSGQEETVAYLEGLDDPRVRLRREPPRGLTATLNLGLRLARGELIARQDADDWSEPDRLERQAAFLAEHPEHVLVGSAAWTHQHRGARLWKAAMPESHGEILAALWKGNPFFHGAAMFRREAALDAGGYREALSCAQDYDFFWRLAEAGRAANLPEALYHYRYGAGSVSARRAREQDAGQRAARRLARDRLQGLPENVGRALEEAAGESSALAAALKQGDHLTLAGDYAQALRAYGSAIRAQPLAPRGWAKLLRLGVFWSAPFAREACFR